MTTIKDDTQTGRDLIESLIDKKEVARITGYSVANIQRLVNAKEIPHLELARAVRFRPSEVNQWLNTFKVEGRNN